ncbi:hypothetical protein BCB4_0101 [Bacillus phage B4]|uniref:Uncharacterized protein n=4 Tax=Bequatrovirus TaxID=1917990 RepID=A0A1X9SGG8_9CAUD|nr:hypothetical protein BCB4_0101 [Bacillus phage B4]YP_008770463.1 hypothetical protein Spock_239 [Bacillus phage Spock]YP_009783695.1 hypothetical protein QLX26_gp099 [Bacillus phage B5S]ARQ95156.1 hypothetical protein FLAPJACK_245 [Bacillus phage Flapjack]MEB9013956.1 hypothetical protein [Bacillus cereus]AEW47333.1 hypothetical protein B5S_0099 [Bacillus phage B5S]AEZ65894.1 hypothetical protein BCB4_0101 [Bacillus phage B4]AGY48639.1 hypothetical protein Spock_239 [Bacillus phage Spock]
MNLLVASCDYHEDGCVVTHYEEEFKSYNIGGVFQLVLKKEDNGFSGYYKVHKTNQTFAYDGTGLSKKSILRDFWDKAKSLGAVDLRFN